MKSVQSRLDAAMRDGNLRVSDLARWFDRPHATVRQWANGDADIGGTAMDRAYILGMLAGIERAIKIKKGFPVPANMSPSDRIAYLKDLREQFNGSFERASQ